LPTSTVCRPKTCKVTVTWALAAVLIDTLSIPADGSISAVTAIDGWLVTTALCVGLAGWRVPRPVELDDGVSVGNAD